MDEEIYHDLYNLRLIKSKVWDHLGEKVKQSEAFVAIDWARLKYAYMFRFMIKGWIYTALRGTGKEEAHKIISIINPEEASADDIEFFNSLEYGIFPKE